MTRWLARAGADATRAEDGWQVVGLRPEDVGRLALEAGVVLTELRAVVADLEDVFIELTAGGGIA